MPLRTKMDAALIELASAREMTKQCSLVLRSGKEYGFWRGEFDDNRDILTVTLTNGHTVAIAVAEVAALHMPTMAPQAGSRGRQV